MAKRSRQEKKSKTGNKPKLTGQTHEEALAITNNVVKPGYTKQQRKEIQKAIEAGIAQFKREYGAKQRDYNKQGKKAIASLNSEKADVVDVADVNAVFNIAYLPWILLVLSWLAFAAFLVFDKT